MAVLDEIGIVPDKFLIDCQLGDGMDGIELVEALRAQYGGVSALIITAFRTAAVRRKCFDADVRIAQKSIVASELFTFLST